MLADARQRALVVALLAALASAALPAQALAHATLERTTPSASATTSTPPKMVGSTFSEGIELRFAIVSATDAGGHQVTDGDRPTRRDGTTLVVPLKNVKQGWYLVYWRVVSADGHPVRGAYTFAVGPSPGPAPQCPIPSLSETAATPALVIERWATPLSLMVGVGLLMFRLIIARPVPARVDDATLRPVSIAAGVALAICLIATPIYLIQATAEFALRSATDVSAALPPARRSSFGWSSWTSSWWWRCSPCAPRRPSGSIGRAGRPARWCSSSRCWRWSRQPPRRCSSPGSPATPRPPPRRRSPCRSTGSTWHRAASGSAVVGLLLLGLRAGRESRRAVLTVAVPRFSLDRLRGHAADHRDRDWRRAPAPADARLAVDDDYGRAILVEVALLSGALSLAAVNLLVTRPALRQEVTRAWGAVGVRRLAGGEARWPPGSSSRPRASTTSPRRRRPSASWLERPQHRAGRRPSRP